MVVRAHIDEESATKKSWITVRVEPRGTIVITPGGYLVKTDDRLHHGLESEIQELETLLQAGLEGRR